MSIINDYKNGLIGAPIDEKERDLFLSTIPMPLYGDYSNETKDSGKGKIGLPYKHVLVFDKEFGAYEAQAVGDCTSHGARNAGMVTVCSDIVLKKQSELFLGRIATEPIYGHRGHSGHGMNPTRAARFVSTVSGLHIRKDYGVVDLRVYNAQIGTRWGARGVPQNIIDLGKEAHIETVSLVKTPEEARDLVYNGYGLTIASSFGFSNRRDRNGISGRSGSWNHCFEEDSIVFTPDGYKNINNFNIGDLVYDHLGNVQKVTHLFNREYDGGFVEILASGLCRFHATECHPMLVSRELEKEEYVNLEYPHGEILVVKKEKLKTKYRKKMWVDAKDLRIGDWLVTPKVTSKKDNFSKISFICNKKCKNKPLDITTPDKDLAWMFGFYIGDGNTTNNHKVSFTFSSNEVEFLNRLKTAFDKLGLKISYKNFGKFYRVHCYSSVLARFFNDNFGKYSKDRIIPKFLMQKGWCLDSLINGIWCADGYYTKQNKKEICMNSKKLIYQIRHILIEKGIKPTICVLKNSTSTYKTDNKRYAICIENKSRSNQKDCDKFIYNPIKSLKYFNKKTIVYNLEVSNSHTFIVDGVSTHNCMSVIAMDDTKQRHSECLFLIQNSWGPHWISGPKFPEDQPEGSFWTTASILHGMIKDGECWVFSGAKGFPSKNLDWSLYEKFL